MTLPPLTPIPYCIIHGQPLVANKNNSMETFEALTYQPCIGWILDISIQYKVSLLMEYTKERFTAKKGRKRVVRRIRIEQIIPLELPEKPQRWR